MYIQPNTTVYLLSGVELDNTYEHTIWFKDYRDNAPTVHNKSIALEFQQNYFLTFRKHTLQQNTYQRVYNGVIRLHLNAGLCYDCNYMMFKNTNHENKWFYAFITSIKYINEGTTEISYEIDVMQTYMYDYKLGMSFIEREHSATDNVGDNTYPEDLEQGEYVITKHGSTYYQGTLTNGIQPINQIIVVFQCAFEYDSSEQEITSRVPRPKLVNGVLNGLTNIPFIINRTFQDSYEESIEEIMNFYDAVERADVWDGIINCFIMPPNFDMSTPYDTNYNSPAGIQRINKSLSYIGNGYVPRNKKLFTSPYNILHIFSDSGSIDLAYEYLDGNYCEYEIRNTTNPTPVAQLRVLNYKNQKNNTMDVQEFETSLVIKDFPQCAISGDTFKIWYAQNGVAYDIGLAGSVLKPVVGAITGVASLGTSIASAGASASNVANSLGVTESTRNMMIGSAELSATENGAIRATGGLIGSLTGIAQGFAQRNEIKTRAASVNGTQTSLSDWAFGMKWFYYKCLSIRNEYAERIDQFFDKFGYKTMKLKIPSIDHRPYWWYTKTLGCEIHNSTMPQDDLKLIASIYDKGVTFWKWKEVGGVNVADYTKDNRV